MPRTLDFPKSRRLTRTAEFAHVRQGGEKWRGALITVAVAPAGDSIQRMRLGIIASRKVGNAVVRNRARRRIREIVRRHQEQIAGSIWLVIIISAKAARATYGELEDEYLRLARRASILAP